MLTSADLTACGEAGLIGGAGTADSFDARADALDPNLKEDGLFEIFGHLGVERVQEILSRFGDTDRRIERAFNVLLEIGIR
jgi:hypothetical protein